MGVTLQREVTLHPGPVGPTTCLEGDENLAEHETAQPTRSTPP